MDLFYVLENVDRAFSSLQTELQYNQSSILFEPPKQLKFMYYRCDTKFHIDNILDMFDDEENYGLCLISSEEVKIFMVTISGDRFDIKMLDKENIDLQTRTRRGGSSSGRYGRICDKAKSYNKNLFSELIVDAYMTENHTKCKIKKLILAGPSDMKKEIADTPLFQQHLYKFLFKMVSTNGIHEHTGEEVMANILTEIKYADVKQVDIELEKIVQYSYDTLLIGKTEIDEHIESGNITKLYVCKSLIKGNDHLTKQFDDLKASGVIVIFTDSSLLKTYGGWMGVKKY
jgi:peptide chain release factor subunit 1